MLSGGFFVLLVGVIVGGFLIGRAAQDAILESQAGSVSEFTLDPTAPGFRAFTEPTPTALVLHTAVVPPIGAELVGVTLLTSAAEQAGGTVVTMPATLLDADGAGVALNELFATEGLDAVTNELRGALRIDFADVVVLDATSWPTLMTADLPLQISLREDLTETSLDGESSDIVLAAGTRPFSLVDIAELAAHRNDGEPSLQIALRHQQIWQSWISRTAGADERPTLFEVGSGFVDLLNSLANAEVAYRVLPMRTVPNEDPTNTTYEPTDGQVNSLISSIVPFPEPASIGDRPTVLLLDTSFGEVPQGPAVTAITEAGGLVSILGNSEEGAERITEVQVHDSTATDVAVAISDALGVDAPLDVPLDGATTAITVVLG